VLCAGRRADAGMFILELGPVHTEGAPVERGRARLNIPVHPIEPKKFCMELFGV